MVLMVFFIELGNKNTIIMKVVVRKNKVTMTNGVFAVAVTIKMHNR